MSLETLSQELNVTSFDELNANSIATSEGTSEGTSSGTSEGTSEGTSSTTTTIIIIEEDLD